MHIDKKNAILAARGSNLRNTVEKPHYKDETPPISRPLDKLVYSNNVFGWPANDIDVMNNTTNPEVKIALERRNLRMPSENGVDDDDVALDVMQRNDESVSDYFDRMQPVIDEAKKDLQSKK